MSVEFHVQHIANTNVYNTQEPLVPTLEFALVEYLHGNDGRVLDDANLTTPTVTPQTTQVIVAREKEGNADDYTKDYLHVKVFVPVWIQCLFDNAGSVRLLCIHGTWLAKIPICCRHVDLNYVCRGKQRLAKDGSVRKASGCLERSSPRGVTPTTT